MAAGAAAENLNSDTTGKNQVFEDARDRFWETLSDEDRSRYSVCASSRDLIDGLYNLDIVAGNGQKSRGARVLKAIKSFSDRLKPFFNVISTYIQADPSPSAFVWGSIRLVLQVSPKLGPRRRTKS